MSCGYPASMVTRQASSPLRPPRTSSHDSAVCTPIVRRANVPIGASSQIRPTSADSGHSAERVRLRAERVESPQPVSVVVPHRARLVDRTAINWVGQL